MDCRSPGWSRVLGSGPLREPPFAALRAGPIQRHRDVAGNVAGNVAGDVAADLPEALHLGRRDLAVPLVHRLEHRAVDRNARGRKRADPPARRERIESADEAVTGVARLAPSVSNPVHG